MPPKIQMKIEESQKIKKNPNHVSRKLKFAIFDNFTNNGEKRDINEGSRE